jgi:ribosomal protein S18 acetylase RimI-like enzyme
MIRYTVDESSEAQVLEHLRACSSNFVPPLDTRIDVKSYAAKLVAHARRFEAWRDTSLVGLIAAYFNQSERSCFVTNVSVTPAEQRKGIAALLLDQCLAAATNAGLATTRLEVSTGAIGARRLYESRGFAVVEERAGQVLMQR